MRYYRPIIVLPLNLWNSFPIMNTFVPGFKLHLIFSQWFNYQQTSIGLDHKFGTTEATNHCLKQKLPNFPMHIWVTGPWGVIRAIICPNRYFYAHFRYVHIDIRTHDHVCLCGNCMLLYHSIVDKLQSSLTGILELASAAIYRWVSARKT